jgi:hypothetical protein
MNATTPVAESDRLRISISANRPLLDALRGLFRAEAILEEEARRASNRDSAEEAYHAATSLERCTQEIQAILDHKLEESARIAYHGQHTVVPLHLVEGLQRYARLRIRTGGFLQACLENDLARAVCLADPVNRDLIPAIALYIYNVLPLDSWGSAQRVSEWLSGREDS